MKKITLGIKGKNKGKYFVLVDDEDYDYLNQWTWSLRKKRENYYAYRHSFIPERKSVAMHRLIMKTPDDMQVDHIDHNGLNNQKYNLRNCTAHQNDMNRTSFGKTGYLGVCYDNGYIKANICVNKKRMHLGMFNTLEEAARARDESSKKYFGEFANLNFKP